MMSKFVYKLSPNNCWQIGKYESWFSDMSKEGLHIVSVGKFFTKFEKDEPKNMKYRIDISYNENHVADDKIKLCEDNGWTYVNSYNSSSGITRNHKFQIFSSPEDLNGSELPCDPISQIRTLKDLKGDLITSSSFFAVFLVVYILLMCLLLFILDKPLYLTLVSAQFHMCLILILECFYVGGVLIQNTSSINRLIKSISKGESINHKMPWKDNSYIFQRLSIFLFSIMLLYLFSQLYTGRKHNITNELVGLPVVTLCEIEDTTNLIRTGTTYSTIKESNNYTLTTNIFASEYNSSEHSTKNGCDLTLSTKFYKLTFPSMADNLLSDLVKEYSYRDSFTEMNNPNFDYLLVNEENNNYSNEAHHTIFVARGNKVMYVQYYGKADLDKILDVISEKMSKGDN